MRKILALILFTAALLIPSRAFAVYPPVQEKICIQVTDVSTLPCTLDSPVTAGHAVIVSAATIGDTPTLSDNHSTSYASPVSGIFFANAIAGGSLTATVNIGSGSIYFVWLAEVPATLAYDSISASCFGYACSDSLVTTATGDLVFAFATDWDISDPGVLTLAGFSTLQQQFTNPALLGNGTSVQVDYQTAGSPGTVSATWQNAPGALVAQLVAFTPSPLAARTMPPVVF